MGKCDPYPVGWDLNFDRFLSSISHALLLSLLPTELGWKFFKYTKPIYIMILDFRTRMLFLKF